MALVIPDSKTTFAKLDAADLSPEGCVIWLDDIDHLIGADGISSGALQRLAQAGNVIIGTIRSAEYDRIQPTDQLRPPEWDVISGFERIFISRELSQGEEDRLDAVVADPGIRARIRNIGIGEYVGAINSGHDEFAARAAYGLGDLLAEQGDAQGARKAFELAINSGHDEYAVSAAYSFGALLTSSPSAPGTPMLRRLRRSASGTLLAMTGDAEGAREALQQAIDSGHAEFAARAKQALDELGSGGRLPTG